MGTKSMVVWFLPVPISSLMGVISTPSRCQATFFSPSPRLPGSISHWAIMVSNSGPATRMP